MIDFNKTGTPRSNIISVSKTIQKTTSNKKLTQDNKKFLKLIGLLK